MLQVCFENTDWGLFAEGANLDEYASSVLGYINVCTGNVITQKTIKVFPNRTPWFNAKVRALLQEDAAFRSGIGRPSLEHKGISTEASGTQSGNTNSVLKNTSIPTIPTACGMASRH